MRDAIHLPAVLRVVSVAVLVGILGPTAGVFAQLGQKRVLVLYATRRDAQLAVVGDRELPRLLEHNLSSEIDYYSEFIDQSRFSNPYYQIAFADFLRAKYAAQRFDLVVAMGDAPLEFLASNRRTLFRDSPLVFFVNSKPDDRPAGSTGLISELNLGDTLRLATALQPSLSHVFVISGAGGSNQRFEAAARQQLRAFESSLRITYLSGLKTQELEQRLSALPARSAVYYLYVDRDGAGQMFHPLEYLDRVIAASNAPVYSWVDSTMDRGIVGGSLKDQLMQTHAVADLAVRVLQGTAADSIPVDSPNLNTSQVDWRQLQRWGISDARIPAGTLVKFREPTVWHRYRIYILGALTLLLAQTVLIAGLLVQRVRRRQAEERSRALAARLIGAQESERARIARELHDDVSQQMALLEMDLEILNGAVQPGTEDLATEALDRARGVARTVHELSHRLHPAKLRLIGLVPALKGLKRELAHSDLEIVVSHEDVPSDLPEDVTLCFFRIVQESLNNAAKHSRARRVVVHLICEPHALQLTVIDDGVGFDVRSAWGKGLGLVSMSERVDAIGGRLTIMSKRGMGTRLHVTVPLKVAPVDASHDPPVASEERAAQLANS